MAVPDYNNPLAGIPTDKVLEMKNSGLSNNQIIQNLQREGFTQTQIFDAMNQAEVKAGVGNIPPDALQSGQPANPMTMGEQGAPSAAQSVPQPPVGAPPAFSDTPSQSIASQDVSGLGSITTEELIETLIDEKWNDLLKDINKIIDWKEKSDLRLSKIEQGLEDIKKNFDTLHKAVVGKVGEYDKHILDVGAEIAAMEKVFQKILPTFTENISELSRLTDSIKSSKSKK